MWSISRGIVISLSMTNVSPPLDKGGAFVPVHAERLAVPVTTAPRSSKALAARRSEQPSHKNAAVSVLDLR
jgi:hypothetical protein